MRKETIVLAAVLAGLLLVGMANTINAEEYEPAEETLAAPEFMTPAFAAFIAALAPGMTYMQAKKQKNRPEVRK